MTELTPDQRAFLADYELKQIQAISKMQLTKTQKKLWLTRLWNELRRIKNEMLADNETQS